MKPDQREGIVRIAVHELVEYCGGKNDATTRGIIHDVIDRALGRRVRTYDQPKKQQEGARDE